MISVRYVPAHPEIFNLTENLFAPSFLKAVKEFKQTKDTKHLTSILKQETPTKIYSFEIFTKDFCEEIPPPPPPSIVLILFFCSKLIQEVENFEKSGLPVSRPNSMNNYGGTFTFIA